MLEGMETDYITQWFKKGADYKALVPLCDKQLDIVRAEYPKIRAARSLYLLHWLGRYGSLTTWQLADLSGDRLSVKVIGVSLRNLERGKYVWPTDLDKFDRATAWELRPKGAPDNW